MDWLLELSTFLFSPSLLKQVNPGEYSGCIILTYRNTEDSWFTGHCLSSLPCPVVGRRSTFPSTCFQGPSLGMCCTSLGPFGGACAPQGFTLCADWELLIDCAACHLAKAESQSHTHSAACFSQAATFGISHFSELLHTVTQMSFQNSHLFVTGPIPVVKLEILEYTEKVTRGMEIHSNS